MDWKSHRIDALLEQALVEDKAASDATTNLTIDPEPARFGARSSRARRWWWPGWVRCRACLRSLPGSIRGPTAHTRFEVISHPEIFDGVRVHEGQVLAVIRHNARVLLSCERVILNLMQHLSGIATLTRKYVDAIQGTKARVLDTRKTVPGLRALEKYAVLCGGGTNHRLDLASGILIKNNHISLGGGLRTALTHALETPQDGPARAGRSAHACEELEEALECGAEAILLDNMSPAQVKSRVERIRTGRALDSDRGLGRHCARKHSRVCRDRRRTSSAWAR